MTVANNYWSATTNATFPDVAWYVYFSDGVVNDSTKFNTLAVRAVRAGS